MAKALTYQCPNCSGVLAFNSQMGALACSHCGASFEAGEIERIYAQRQADADAQARRAGAKSGAKSGAHASRGDASRGGESSSRRRSRAASRRAQPQDPIAAYIARAKWDGLSADQVQSLDCSSCGARFIADITTAAASCPYCGNNAIVAGQLSGTLKPDLVIPFKVSKDEALAALREHCKGKKLLPNAFTAENHLEEITGVYVPFWLYSGAASASLSASARKVRVWADAKNVYTVTNHYKVHRSATMLFARVPVDGSTKMPDGHMDAIEPFDYSALLPFSLGYLHGFLADRYDQDVDFCADRMRRRVAATCEDRLRESIVGFDEVDQGKASSSMRLDGVSYALLPVWMLHTSWQGGDYLFAVNGQTGKLVGDLPIDDKKAAFMFVRWFTPSFIAILALLFIIVGLM